MSNKKILITGIAGFIGYHLAKRLADQGETVVGIDNINEYYDVNLKFDRLTDLGFQITDEVKNNVSSGIQKSNLYPKLSFYKMDLNNAATLKSLIKEERFDIIVNLAAQAGVRYSLTNPDTYISSNMQGFLNLLEAVRDNPVKHLVYASSSSVYGLNSKQPYSETDTTDNPASLYAVTKKANELMAHSYAHLYGIPITGLRFFTVYGPWGRPDMALFLFTKAILSNQPIDVFNNGDMRRDFTYIDDILEGIIRVMYKFPDSLGSPVITKVYNIGNSSPVRLLDFIHALEEELGVKAQMNMLPMQPGDVPSTWADCSALKNDTGYQPCTNVREGIKKFAAWYREYYKL
jgi:UDP-glucuronate 4-epimerase